MSDTTGWYAYKKSAGGSDARAWDTDATLRLLDDSEIDRCWLFTLSGLYGFNDYRGANDEVIDVTRDIGEIRATPANLEDRQRYPKTVGCCDFESVSRSLHG